MKIIFVLFSIFTLVSANSQISTEFTIGPLQSLGSNKFRLVSSSSQAVGVSAPTWLRYSRTGIRARGTLSYPLADKLNLMFHTGFNFRSNEYLWGTTYAYLSIPIQGGFGYSFMKKKKSVFSINVFSGINMYKIQNKLARQQGGFIQNGELSYSFIKSGFFKSLILKTGYEYQVDNETFFYRTNDTFFKDEDFHYKVRRSQVYFAVGVGL